MRIGIDIGGTFTDLVAADEDGLLVVKVSSTPSDPSDAFHAALERLGAAPTEVRHGTTVGTNAVLTRSGARLAFLATEGFRHLLQLARQDRPSLYDLTASRPEPLVARELCIGVPERVGADGAVVRALAEDATREALASLAGRVEGIAVTLLHAYADPEHERRIASLAEEVLPGVAVSLSSDVLPEFREYERASTTALNAYVQPVVSRYLDRVRDRAGDVRVGVMWSGGGVRAIEHTSERPVHTLLSGPAAGVLGAAWAARGCGVDDFVSLDMGGTSADVAVVEGGKPAFAEEASLDGLPFRTPCVDVVSVGAGGGSIGWVDDGGALRVGPRSAGADPGPACYGRGGDEATVTDAQAVLGFLGGDALAGGEVALDVDRAVRAVARLGARCGLSTEDTAEGILRVVRATMARAIRSVSIERGKDVRRFALAAFGGAGPLHACALAAELGMSRVVVPPVPGALAALGLLVASRRADASVSRPMPCDPVRNVELRSILHELTERVLAELAEEGVGFVDATIELAVDLRYEGQSHELRLPVAGAPSFAKLADAFHAMHQERYGFSRPRSGVEAVTFRAAAAGPAQEVSGSPPAGREARAAGRRRVAGDDVPVYVRDELPSGATVEGPALVTEVDSTTWVDIGWRATVEPGGSLAIERG